NCVWLGTQTSRVLSGPTQEKEPMTLNEHRLIDKLKAERVPYWQAGDALLINGDCLKVLPWIEAGSVDAVVTDPPYGISLENHAAGRERRNRDWTIAGDDS